MEHHADHDEEILAIVAHELGHWKKAHMTKLVIFNVFYATVFGALMIPVIEHDPFLAAFGIYHQSYVMQLLLFGLLYQNSVDVVGRFLIRYIQREIEYSADAYSVKIGYG